MSKRGARPHDLLRLAAPEALVPASAPDWVVSALRATPWVVVRRATAPTGFVAVGVRGETRAQRYAMAVPVTAVIESVAPEMLVSRADALSADVPAGRSLQMLDHRLDALGLPWGPTGSAGFELASRAPTVTRDSDLDILVRPSHPCSRSQLGRFWSVIASAPSRVDCQVETVAGAIALGEIIAGAQELLLRTPSGPRLAPSPWRRAS